MIIRLNRHSIVAATTLILLMTSGSALAFRCGQKLVLENMHEVQVRRACGAPTTERQLGVTLRGVHVPVRSISSGGVTVDRFPGYGPLVEEVIITEYVYNFGPRKLMRRLVFEGGVLAKIETLGYGYREKKSK
jgi:hypothetical protein